MKTYPYLKYIASVSCSLALASGALFADEEEEYSHDFLFLVDDAYLEEEGEWQVAIKSGVFRDLAAEEDDEVVDEDLFFSEVEIEYGLSETISLELVLPYERITVTEPGEEKETYSGIGDIEVGLSFLLLHESESLPALSLSIEASAPTGDEDHGLGRGVWGWEASLGSSKQLSYGLHFHSQLGFEFANNLVEDGEIADEREYSYGFALAQRVNETAAVLLELSGEYEEERSHGETESGHALYLGPGALVELESGWEIGANLVVGLTDDSYDWGGGLKASIEF